MKLIIAIVQDDDAPGLVDSLMEAGFYVTKLATSGGFLRSGNTTMLTGVDDERVDVVLEIIRKRCRSRKQITAVQPPVGSMGGMFVPTMPIQVTVGGATVFTLDVDQFHKF